MTADDLAGILLEHAVATIAYTGREVDGICCASPACAEGGLAIEFPDMDAFAAHQAAVIDAWLTGYAAEAKARAWDKGYGKGREDGSAWQVAIGGVRGKASRNPYRRGEEA